MHPDARAELAIADALTSGRGDEAEDLMAEGDGEVPEGGGAAIREVVTDVDVPRRRQPGVGGGGSSTSANVLDGAFGRGGMDLDAEAPALATADRTADLFGTIGDQEGDLSGAAHGEFG
jgi:hypothetical protein